MHILLSSTAAGTAARAVAATTSTTVANAVTAKSVSATSLMFQLVIGLGVVLGIIWVGARVMRGRMGINASRRKLAPLAVIGRQPLGKGVQLAVVRAGTQTFLLGVTAHQVTRLARFRPEEVEAFENPAAASGPSGSGRVAGPDSPDDLPPAVGTSPGSPLPVPFSLQSTIRRLQDRTVRR